ncbi:MAG: FKBP-type peptidyl-prolyl cis-trans isomerase [Chitinophagales bacterium]
MKKLASCGLIVSVILLAIACNNNNGLKKTKSGVLYKIMSDGKGNLVKNGQFLKLSLVQKIKDSVIYTSVGGMPAYVRVDSGQASYSVAEVFGLLRKGDSAVVILLGDSIAKITGKPLPPNFKGKDKISFYFKVLDLFPTQELVLADRQNESEKEKIRESKTVEDYVAQNKINAQKTALGTFVEIKSPGDGIAVDSGKLVSILYTGKSLATGKVFQSNMTGPKKDPFKFVVGGDMGAIKGMDDALRLFKKGGKGTLYIPAYLAYDAQPGPDGKPFENLIFDIEVVDVADAPKQPNPTPPTHALPQTAKVQPKKTK